MFNALLYFYANTQTAMDTPERKPEDILHLSVTLKWSLIQMRRWMRFLGWVQMIAGGFLAVAAMAVILLGTSNLGENMLGINPAAFAFFYLIMAAIVFLPGLWLVRAGNNFTRTLDKADQIYFQEGIKHTARYFTFNGVMVALMLAAYVLVLGFVILGFATGTILD